MTAVPTAFDVIAQAMVDAFLRAPAVSPKVKAQRFRSISEQDDSYIVVRTAGADPDRAGIRGAPVDWTTTLAIECYGRAGSEDESRAQIDALLAGVCQRIQDDPSLGGIALDCTPGRIRWDWDAGDRYLGCVVLAVEVLHRTGSNNLLPV